MDVRGGARRGKARLRGVRGSHLLHAGTRAGTMAVMKHLWIGAAGLLVCAAGMAHDFKLGALTIAHPYARPTVAAQPTGGAYLKLVNQGTDDRLVAVTVEPRVAERVEMHSMAMEGDVMRMREVPAIDIPAGQTVELKPGGLHLMFIGLKTPFVVGQRFPVKLRFREAGEISVEIQVDAPAAGAPAAHKH